MFRLAAIQLIRSHEAKWNILAQLRQASIRLNKVQLRLMSYSAKSDR
ncbi:hypothetical protein SAMN05216417_102133 [Nitrosospira multiformis]|uniref:Uncharacterized protein n=1 Tax=Nitrosospira multiformis TaxID=1231 RepID=A0A1I7FR61_9PROT|nr:hypothetical protein SAMN05216417_102133 [Nitrosospira multiformis]